MLDRALAKARRGEDKKVNINFQLPSNLKDEFEKLCKTNGVSVTSMLNSMIEVAIEEHKGIKIDNSDILRLLEHQRNLTEDLNWYKEHEKKLTDEQIEDMMSVKNSLNAIFKELQKKD
jgi:hypothetical protein